MISHSFQLSAANFQMDDLGLHIKIITHAYSL